jgi:Uma2 family endonuclease
MAIAVQRLHRITSDIYERMAESGMLPERGIELIDGLVVTMSPKGDRHASAVTRLTKQLVLQASDRFEVYTDSLSLRLGPQDMPEPDIAVARATRDYSRERPRPDEIALIIEVADSSWSFDLNFKCVKYAKAGIPEYWVVDLERDTVHVFRQVEGDVYVECRTARAPELLSPAEYPDVVIDIARVIG